MRGNLEMRLLLVLLLIATPAWAEKPVRTLDGRTLTSAQIDAQVQSLMRAESVAGMGLALVRDGRVVFQNSYGLRNVEQKLPLEPDTIIYGASLTKATFATFVMQLVGEGKLDLDRPIAA